MDSATQLSVVDRLIDTFPPEEKRGLEELANVLLAANVEDVLTFLVARSARNESFKASLITFLSLKAEERAIRKHDEKPSAADFPWDSYAARVSSTTMDAFRKQRDGMLETELQRESGHKRKSIELEEPVATDEELQWMRKQREPALPVKWDRCVNCDFPFELDKNTEKQCLRHEEGRSLYSMRRSVLLWV